MASILGIGIDAIEPARIEQLLATSEDRFVQRIFTAEEIAYCESKKNRAQHYAARFAAKEALMKALGTGKQLGLTWKDIEVTHDELGQPLIRLSGRGLLLAKERGVTAIHLSLTHLRHLALAVVILEAQERKNDLF